ncbi:hypothetical protein PFLUV_G00050160 [Perca fluviatilis]|uniref:Uncharacterized protein n=1 Tax=Perca fluviatilis TaxID=8168 RepID=A0A6A5FM91_PERFL|nr:hypothetical protein PFLUV_G00050160 [Perca fluviatilis]
MLSLFGTFLPGKVGQLSTSGVKTSPISFSSYDLTRLPRSSDFEGRAISLQEHLFIIPSAVYEDVFQEMNPVLHSLTEM